MFRFNNKFYTSKNILDNIMDIVWTEKNIPKVID